MPLKCPYYHCKKKVMDQVTFEQLPSAVCEIYNKIEALEKLLIEQGNGRTEDESNQLLTAPQAAVYLNIKLPTLYSKVSKRELPVMKRGKKLYFSKKELLEYLKTGRKKTMAELDLESKNFKG